MTPRQMVIVASIGVWILVGIVGTMTLLRVWLVG